MRRATLTLIAGPRAALTVSAPAQARSGYCSSSGDVCYSAKRVGGRLLLVLDTFSFQGRVRACVKPPTGVTSCRSFRTRARAMGIYGIRARWSAHFPNRGAGTYGATFSYGGTTLGPAVSFAVR